MNHMAKHLLRSYFRPTPEAVQVNNLSFIDNVVPVQYICKHIFLSKLLLSSFNQTNQLLFEAILNHLAFFLGLSCFCGRYNIFVRWGFVVQAKQKPG